MIVKGGDENGDQQQQQQGKKVMMNISKKTKTIAQVLTIILLVTIFYAVVLGDALGIKDSDATTTKDSSGTPITTSKQANNNNANKNAEPSHHPQYVPSENRFQALRVAHAGGGIQTPHAVYTNSYEALNRNLELGFQYFELDFSITADDEIVCLHDWTDSFNRSFGYMLNATTIYVHNNATNTTSTKKETEKLTLEEFEMVARTKSLLNYTKCTLPGLAQWMIENPATYIVTDAKEDNIHILEKVRASLPNSSTRVIPQIYFPSRYEVIKNMGYEQMIWTLYRKPTINNSQIVDFVHTYMYGSVAITMPTWRAKTALPKQLQSLNIKSYVHTINRKDELASYQNKFGLTEVYTDYLVP